MQSFYFFGASLLFPGLPTLLNSNIVFLTALLLRAHLVLNGKFNVFFRLSLVLLHSTFNLLLASPGLTIIAFYLPLSMVQLITLGGAWLLFFMIKGILLSLLLSLFLLWSHFVILFILMLCLMYLCCQVACTSRICD